MNKKVFNVVIVDDEPLARAYLVRLIETYEQFRVVGEAKSGKEGLRSIEQFKPDLLFLDVQMPEMDGFALLRELPKSEVPLVVFTTAFEEYAIRAFEHHAIDYLLKPFDRARFSQTLEHSEELLGNKHLQNASTLRLAELLESTGTKTRYMDRIPVKKDGKIILIETRKIGYIEADDKYLYLYSVDGKYMVRQSLKSLLAKLDPYEFVRANRSIAVNLNQIEELHQGFKNKYRIVLRGGHEVSLSRSCRHGLFEKLGKPM